MMIILVLGLLSTFLYIIGGYLMMYVYFDYVKETNPKDPWGTFFVVTIWPFIGMFFMFFHVRGMMKR